MDAGSSEKSIAYATATSAIIGCPYKIETVDQARVLPKVSSSLARMRSTQTLNPTCSRLFQVGPKILLRIHEFLETGKIIDAGESNLLGCEAAAAPDGLLLISIIRKRKNGSIHQDTRLDDGSAHSR